MRRQQFLVFRVYRFHDTGAYGELYDLYHDRIYRYLHFKLPKPEDTDELTAEVFLRGWEYATSSHVENVNALFYRIARNLIADFYRRRVEEEGIDSAHEIAVDDAMLERLAVKEEVKELMKAIYALKDEYRDVLIMRYLDDMNASDIAEALEKTPNNIRVTLHRAKRALEEQMGNQS